jgi:NTP pyrophosphatase (non-canonical NTP hydrolase)
MFERIYPRALEDSSKSVVALFEEVGELAEAVRVFERFPKYFAGEAADVFSYIMGIANEYNLQLQRDEERQFDFEAEYLRRYPGLCVQCGYPVCVCPLVPDSTVGRMAKELDVNRNDLFVSNFESYRDQSIQVAQEVLRGLGGYSEVARSFPFDRGEANHALMIFFLELADKVESAEVAVRLRSAALKAGSEATYAGSPKRLQALQQIVQPIKDVLQNNKVKIEKMVESSGSLSSNVGNLVIQELVMGDKYVAGSTVAQGRSVAMNFGVLADELAKVEQHLRSKGDPAASVAADEVHAAEESARQEDPRGVLKSLAKAGKWPLRAPEKLPRK